MLHLDNTQHKLLVIWKKNMSILGSIMVSSNVVDPTSESAASISFILDGKNYKSRFHSHPRGPKINSNGINK